MRVITKARLLDVSLVDTPLDPRWSISFVVEEDKIMSEVYKVRYSRNGGEWQDFRGRNGTGLYDKLATAKAIASRLVNRGDCIAYVYEMRGEWIKVEAV